ncbi:MAG TPA: endonuclease/exonuclease/phosphatase family protein [Candidatus Hydrogenedentes bacterium]|nr:endonuclease/exonuclease/phosphatase family protein [Candidatus Hydrogenedentota bacterium]
MRFVLYNIRYGTGSGWHFHLPVPFSGYFRRPQDNLRALSGFLRSLDPDIVGLVEVDNGSYLAEKVSQAEAIAGDLGFSHVYESKYPQTSIARRVPVLKEQGNAFLTNQRIETQGFHYFDRGIKRLVIELEFSDFVIFLVHLSLKYRHRQYQLSDLYSMFAAINKPMLVAGDFNVLWGDRELHLFLAASGLINANHEGAPTFPSWSPKREIDFILHSPQIKIRRFSVPHVRFSDHLPIVCDFEVAGTASAKAADRRRNERSAARAPRRASG